MKERHHEIKRRLIAGDRAVDIARSMGMTQSWLSIVMASPVFESELLKEREIADRNATDIGARLTRLAPDAMNVLEKAVRERSENIPEVTRVKFAQDVLDRVGHGKPTAVTPGQTSVRVELVTFQLPSVAEATVVINNETIIEKVS